MKILTLDYKKLCEAFVYHVFYMYLNKPSDKYDVHYHAEIYANIDLMFEENNNHIVIQFRDYHGKNPYIAIHQSDKEPADIENVFNGLSELELDYLVRASNSKEYCFHFNTYPITTGVYFMGNDVYSGMSWEEFLENGGNSISVLFDSVQDSNFPDNLNDYHKSKLNEEWKKIVYDELVCAYSSKNFDIYESCFRNYITKEQFRYFERIILECSHINVLNRRKRNLFQIKKQ